MPVPQVNSRSGCGFVLDLDPDLVVSFAPMQNGAEIMATKKRGRPKAEVQLRPITVNFDPSFLARIDRARERRRGLIPGFDVTISDTVRALLEKALTAEEQAEVQAELPFTASPESSTTKT